MVGGDGGDWTLVLEKLEGPCLRCAGQSTDGETVQVLLGSITWVSQGCDMGVAHAPSHASSYGCRTCIIACTQRPHLSVSRDDVQERCAVQLEEQAIGTALNARKAWLCIPDERAGEKEY